MGKFLKVLKVAGGVAEIIVASSIVVELIERYRVKKKVQALYFAFCKSFHFLISEEIIFQRSIDCEK